MNDCTFVLFGASGDLAKRKLIPALYRLYVHKRIKKLLIIGVALDDITIAQLLESARTYIIDCDTMLYQAFAQCIHYRKLNFLHADEFRKLAQEVDDYEQALGMSGNRIFYLATASDFFCQITQQLAASGLAKKWNKHAGIHHRIVYEKPFGHDAASAHAINECIAQLYQEEQIYRIDHYLSKELVSNIALIRFTNCVFEPLWNNRYIDAVQIILSEQVCVGARGVYYDKYGALSDVVQNHMLEMVALLGMESPEKLTGEYIRNQRARVLQKIIIHDALLGQYKGYLQEPGVAADSTTETFAVVKLMIQNHRWAGVPFYLKTGKCLDKKETIICIKFKQVDCLLVKNCPTDSNYLTIRITPDASFSLTLNAKKPGQANEIIPV
jgi:glucose-6-phosphate 1-dehydrogenase